MTFEQSGNPGRRLRAAMIGGGANSFIGETHRIAMRADGLWELVAGAFSRNPAVSQETAAANLIAPDRVYTDVHELIAREKARPDPVDAVVVATPPSSHREIVAALLAADIHVICEKPVTTSLAEVGELAALARGSRARFLSTNCYSGYPMVRAARDLIRQGVLGEVRIVDVAFHSGFYGTGEAVGDWRLSPDELGGLSMLADLGAHVFHMAEFVSGRPITEVAGALQTLAPQHRVPDNAYVSTRHGDGTAGRVWLTYQATGSVHGLKFSIYGDRASVSWDHEDAERLWLREAGKPAALLTKGGELSSPGALASTRFSAGHPDGYGLAFANLYRDFGRLILADAAGAPPPLNADLLPGLADSVRIMSVIEAVVASNRAGSVWCPVEVAGEAIPARERNLEPS